MNPQVQRPHLPALDGLRGAAVLLVFGFHFVLALGLARPGAVAERGWPAKLARLGQSGVDLFFVLSGFLITGILVDARKTVRPLTTFYLRRAVRILSALLPEFSPVLCRVAEAGTRVLGAALDAPVVPGVPAERSPYVPPGNVTGAGALLVAGGRGALLPRVACAGHQIDRPAGRSGSGGDDRGGRLDSRPFRRGGVYYVLPHPLPPPTGWGPAR